MKEIDRSLTRPACLVLVAAGCRLAVASQSSAKNQFYSTVYWITLNSNCGTHREFKNLRKIVEDREVSQI
jgi:hypothetical protein